MELHKLYIFKSRWLKVKDTRSRGHSQEFTKGDKPGVLGTEVPSKVQGQNMETLENTNGAVTKIDLR